MPIYDYQCNSCDRRFELLVRGSSIPQCPHCGGTELAKCVTAPAAPARSKALIASARRQAQREGHFSHYSSAEKKRLAGK